MFKIKRDSKGNVERYKARPIAKDSLKQRALTIKRLSLRFSWNILLELSWHWWLTLIGVTPN